MRLGFVVIDLRQVLKHRQSFLEVPLLELDRICFVMFLFRVRRFVRLLVELPELVQYFVFSGCRFERRCFRLVGRMVRDC